MATKEDTFIEGADTTLASHTPSGTNAGMGWTLEEQDNTALTFEVVGATDVARPTGGGNSARLVYTMQPNPTVTEYDVQVTLPAVATGAGGADDVAALVARLTDSSNYYVAGTYGSASAADKKLVKVVGGARTELTSTDAGTAAGDVLKFEIRDATKKLYVNTVEILSTADNALTSAGRVGLAAGRCFTSTTDDLANTYNFDDFSYVEQAATGPTTAESMPAIAGAQASGVFTGLMRE